MMSRIQKVVTELENWGEKRGLKFNASKTVVIIFTKSRIKAHDYPNRLLVGNNPVEFSNSVKYLGVTFDSKHLWTEHFNSQLTKWKQYLFTLKKSVYKPGDQNRCILDGFTLQLSDRTVLWSDSMGPHNET